MISKSPKSNISAGGGDTGGLLYIEQFSRRPGVELGQFRSMVAAATGSWDPDEADDQMLLTAGRSWYVARRSAAPSGETHIGAAGWLQAAGPRAGVHDPLVLTKPRIEPLGRVGRRLPRWRGGGARRQVQDRGTN